MSLIKLNGSDGNKADACASQRNPEKRIIFLQMKEASLHRTRSATLVTCDPQGKSDDLKLENRLTKVIEPELTSLVKVAGGEGKTVLFMVALSDKSHLNPIRLLGGESCGDQAMLAFSDCIGKAMGDVEAANGNVKMSMHLMRVAPRSDEGVIVIGGAGLSASTHIQLDMALKNEMAHLDLSAYTYKVEINNGHESEVYELNLGAFSRILKYPEMVKAGHFSIGSPVLFASAGTASGFILEEIRRLENSESGFFERFKGIYRGNDGLPEVRTPFKGNLKSMGEKRRDHGTYVEIKLAMTPEQAAMFLPLTKDVRDEHGALLEKGTRKGFAEIFSGRGGMRFLNTFFGKARANSIITPITLAMWDIRCMGIDVVPVSGGYLQYWVDAADGVSTAEMIERAIRARINSQLLTDDVGYINIAFRPFVLTMDASNVDVDDVRARFILKSLGKEHYPVEVLSKADFLVNFLEHVNRDIQNEIFRAMVSKESGGRRLALTDAEQFVIDSIRRICSMRRTIRDTEDLIWTLRNDMELPQEIRERKNEIEKGFWTFAIERYAAMFRLLTKRIQDEMIGQRSVEGRGREFGQSHAKLHVNSV